MSKKQGHEPKNFFLSVERSLLRLSSCIISEKRALLVNNDKLENMTSFPQNYKHLSFEETNKTNFLENALRGWFINTLLQFYHKNLIHLFISILEQI